MHDSGVFIFGTKIFHESVKKDAISCLPLELSWLIFSFLDNTALRCASHANKTWKSIIIANAKLRDRLNKFELAMVLGSKHLVKYARKSRRKHKKKKKYLESGKCTDQSMGITIHKSKRKGDDINLYTKRYKLY